MSENNNEIISKTFANGVLLPQVVALLDEGHTVTLPLRGISMRPFLEDQRDKALLVKATNTRVGDVVLAEIEPRHYVLHRVVGIDGDQVTLRGDGNLATEHCELKDVKAFALGFYRKGRSRLETTDSLKWRVYSWLWCKLLPYRSRLLMFWNYETLPARIKGKLKRMVLSLKKGKEKA